MDPVLVDRRDAALWITINRPERRNAINEAVIRAIAGGVVQAQTMPEVRAIVLTGAGDKAFCAGGDLNPNAEGVPFTVDPADPRNYVIDLFKIIEDCTLPIIARVNGHALAGGLGLLCACDLAVAVDTATFGTPESKIGLFPMMILPYMMRTLSRRRLMELCITGDPLTAAEALEAGLVNKIVPAAELDGAIEAYLGRIVARSPSAIRLGKMGFHAMQDMGLRQAFEYAQLMLPMMARTEDAREGMRAFGEKRQPVWTGR
ncbi:enoyl-CoA hydratase/carnithine racemase [Rhodoligotrophos appendicifer]|uniref:enoyl-CoA hydratase-related protein n=1 Tax=Rhodoligotrophos appendicifer TaxID=987056 RepID=UPI001FE739DF|nr:enoyl-CoA hydratase-related protein [Rhodoligotrophos appendicifer]